MTVFVFEYKGFGGGFQMMSIHQFRKGANKAKNAHKAKVMAIIRDNWTEIHQWRVVKRRARS